jgi:tetratricopeptide (TPR) repeat protein
MSPVAPAILPHPLPEPALPEGNPGPVPVLLAGEDPWAPLLGYALTLRAAGQRGEAARLCHDVLRAVPIHPLALELLAVQASEDDRPDEALALFDRLVTLYPDFVGAHRNRALARLALGDADGALAGLDAALALVPDDADLWFNRGNALWQQGAAAAAVASYDAALARQPELAAAWSNRAQPLIVLGALDAALSSAARALVLAPGHARFWNNLGGVLQVSDAHAALGGMLAGVPERPAALASAGAAPRDGLLRALACFAHAAALDPGYALARWNRGLARLTLGDLPAGFADAEARWAAPELRMGARLLPRPAWRGEAPLAGRTLLLHAEQGFGDTLQFARYAPLLAMQGEVVLEVPAPLLRLLRRLDPAVRVVETGAALPDFDLHCPLPSLPLACGSTLATIPAAVPYLSADPAEVAAWQAVLAALPGRRIGLVWAGGTRPDAPHLDAVDRRRSLALERLAPLATVPGASFVSLQVGPAAAQAAAPPDGLVLHDWTGALHDFAATAALVAALDLVVTVDTAVAHLAGALGRPVWIMNRYDACWRWLLQREDSPWYPTARLFRQATPGDWNGVVADVVVALREFVAG